MAEPGRVSDKGLVVPRNKKSPVGRSLLIFVALCALVPVGASSAARESRQLGPPTFVVGASEDQMLGYDDGGAALFQQMGSYGLGAVRISVDYEPSTATTVQQQDQVQRAIDAATQSGIRPLISIAPGHAADVTSDPNGVRKFSQYAAVVAGTFPQVTDFIIGNEPNLGRFWAPTYKPNGAIASAGTYEAALAASYDALKAVNPNIDVIGLAISSHGDDRPGSARNTISPVRFIKALGDAYRASRRTKPIMDNVALHPYPNPNTDPPDKGLPWPGVGVPNLNRAQQAFWDAFKGTAQPRFAENAVTRRQAAAPGPPLRWVLDEVGWQTDTTNLPGYFGTENTPPVNEATQARYYKAVVQRYACDEHVAAVLFFHWIDESDRDRLQSGFERADQSLKPAARAVKDAIGAGCTGTPVAWRHSTKVDGAGVTWKPGKGFLFFAKAFEEARYTAKATPTKRASARARRLRKRLKPVQARGKLTAYLKKGIAFKGIKLKNAANYTYSVKLTATMNPRRSMTFKTKRLKRPDVEL
jgi:hypothetical protein